MNKQSWSITNTTRTLSKHACVIAVLTLSAHALALEPMTDAQMSTESGKGIAFLPENFSIAFDDTAFIHLKSVGPLNATATAAGLSPLDIYTYGLSIGKSNGTTADRLVGNIGSWGTGNNPFIIKAYTPTGTYNYNGTTSSIGTISILFPDYQVAADGTVGADAYNLKMSMWSDYMIRNTSVVDPIMADPTNASIGTANQFSGRLRLQTVWDGFSVNGSEFNIFQTGSDFGAGSSQNGTLGITGKIRLNSKAGGVLRMSTQVSSGEIADNGTIAKMAGAAGVAPTFQGTEGVYLTDLHANIVLGRLNYQPLTISQTAAGNNLELELARIPNVATVYNDFYADYSGTAADNAKQCTATSCGAAATHSNISIGNISFKNGAGTAVDLGSANISGLMINHLKITTTGL